MIWNDHSKLKGKHAILSPSSNAWIRYSDEELKLFKSKEEAKIRGTALHNYAQQAIILQRRQFSLVRDTVAMYINDCIDNDMQAEVQLYYSDNCFGTADAISYENGFLKIFDLKTGDSVEYFRWNPDIQGWDVHYDQLLIYAALFCLEYKVRPNELKGCELRVYQSDNCVPYTPTVQELDWYISQIINANIIVSGKEPS